jgi:hypothetical protein
MKRLMIFLLILLIPVVVSAKEKKHIKTLENQECIECHASEAQLWEGGKHGLMNVKCVVCHGSPDENFVAKPDINRCKGCHYEKVADVEKKLPPKIRQCSLCHALHSVKNKFHSEGGEVK